jgi:hypothetical protein
MQLLHEPLGAVAAVRLTTTFCTLQSVPINATTSGAGTVNPSGVHPRFLVGFVLLDL